MLFPLVEIGQKPRSKAVFNQNREVLIAKVLLSVYFRQMPLKNQNGFLEELLPIPANSTVLMTESSVYLITNQIFSSMAPQTNFWAQQPQSTCDVWPICVGTESTRCPEHVVLMAQAQPPHMHRSSPGTPTVFFIKNVGRCKDLLRSLPSRDTVHQQQILQPPLRPTLSHPKLEFFLIL